MPLGAGEQEAEGRGGRRRGGGGAEEVLGTNASSKIMASEERSVPARNPLHFLAEEGSSHVRTSPLEQNSLCENSKSFTYPTRDGSRAFLEEEEE